MPTPVAVQATSANVALPQAAKGLPDAAAILDFAALLFAQAETPAVPGLTVAAPSDSEAKPGESGESAQPGLPEGLQALLAAVILPGAGNTLPTPPPIAAPVENLPAEALPAVEAASSEPTDPTALLANRPAKSGDGETANFSDFAGSDASTGQHEPSAMHHLPAAGNVGASDRSGAAASTAVRVDTPIGDARWSSDFGQRVVWLARQDIQSAQISINPPNLGPIDVSIKLGPDQASAVFSSPHADVREALESALPRLREMLAGAGIQLGDAHVNAQNQQHAAQQQKPHAAYKDDAAYPGSAILSATDANGGGTLRMRAGNGLVDTFA